MSAWNRKRFLIVLGAAGLLVALLSFLVLLAPRLVNIAAVQRRVLSKLERQAGVRLSFERAELVFFPRPRLTLEGVSLSVPGRAEGTVKRLEAGVSPFSLFRSRLLVGSLLAVAPEIRVRIPEREKTSMPLSLEEVEEKISSLLAQMGSRAPGATVTVRDGRLDLAYGERSLLSLRDLQAAVAFPPDRLRLRLSCASQFWDRLDVEGTLRSEGVRSLRLDVSGGGMEIPPVRSAVLSLAGDVPAVRSVLDVVRGGSLPRFSVRVVGNSVEDLADLAAVEGSALLRGGTIFLPGVGGDGLTLSEVAGSATLSKGTLYGEGITARNGNVRAREGTVRLGLGQADPPFHADFLAAADPGEAQSLVRRIVTDPDFRRELDRFKELAGFIAGRVTLGERLSSIRPTVQGTEVRLATRYDRFPFPLTISGGGIAYEGNRIATSGLHGRLGASSFSGLTGNLQLGEVPRVTLSSGQARLSLDELIPWLSSTRIANERLKGLRSARGTVEVASIAGAGPLGTAGNWQYEATGRAIDVVLDGIPLPGPVTIRRGEFHLRPGTAAFSGIEASLLDARVRGSAECRFSGGEVTQAAGSIEGEVGGEATGWASSRLHLPPEVAIRAPLSATASSFSWEKGGPLSFKGEFHRPGDAVLSVSLRRTPEELAIDSLVFRDPRSDASLALRLGTREVRLNYKGALYRSTVEKFAAIPGHPFRRLEGELSLSVDLESPGRSEAKGTLEGEGIRIPWKPLDPLRIRRASISAEGKRIRVASSDLAWREVPFRLRGEGSFSGEGLVADVDVEAGDVPLERLIPSAPGAPGTVPDDAGYRLPKIPVRGVLRLRSDSIRYGRWAADSVIARGELGPEALYVSVSGGDLCGFPLRLSATLDPKELAVEFQTSASGADLKVPLLCLLDRQVDATGSFRFATRLSARGNDPESLLRSLEGPVELTARDGRIYRWTLLSKILAVLNVTNVVRGKFPDFRGEGLPYKAAKFRGEQKGKVLHLTEGTLNGPTIGIAASGRIDLGTSQADVKVLVAPFRTADWIIRKVPLVRYVMKKTLVSVPFTVKGDYRDPSVSFDPVGVGAGLLGVLGRTIELPVKILEDVLPDSATQK